MSYFVHESSYVDEGAVIGEGTKIWHFCHIMAPCEIGKNCNIGQNVVIAPDVILGNYVKIQNNVSVYTGVICEDYVFLGPSCVFTNVKNPRAEINRRGQYEKTLLKRGVTIGANATIVCGITLEEYVFVGAGSVVTKSFPAFALVYGNPAKQVGWISQHGHILHFNSEGLAICPESGKVYRLHQGKVIPL
ncbi:MAG: N-acetyltransferase [Bacteroidia bacterium]|nr:MAG: N-acetyltransferase [Bacteroidia bacterium]